MTYQLPNGPNIKMTSQEKKGNRMQLNNG